MKNIEKYGGRGMIQVAVFGYGNIGGGVVDVIEQNQDVISKAAGDSVQVKYVLDLRDFEGDPIQSKVVHDVEIIIQDPDIKIICETMGGNEPAYTFTKKALEQGKSVCTSNKELVANHGAELIKIAAEHNCNYFFEASVGGGIPIIRTIKGALKQEHILKISGIVNGTTNYILTKMAREGVAFDVVLKEAQEKGYAERNPEADVEGHDACRKIAILSSLMSGKTVDFKQIYTEGITKITAEDFLYANQMGKAIKLLAMSKRLEAGYLAMVAPFLISSDYPLYNVNDVFNGIFVKGNMLDDSMYYGRGAGKLPTASAVVADVIECARFMGTHLPLEWTEEKASLVPIAASKRSFFVRIRKEDISEEKAKEIFGKGEIVQVAKLPTEYGFITQTMTEKDFQEITANQKGIISCIRMES